MWYSYICIRVNSHKGFSNSDRSIALVRFFNLSFRQISSLPFVIDLILAKSTKLSYINLRTMGNEFIS